MHASCESPWHSLAKRARLGGLLPPQVAFQEHAAHPPRWPGELSSKGSSDTSFGQIIRIRLVSHDYGQPLSPLAGTLSSYDRSYSPVSGSASRSVATSTTSAGSSN